jgi:hypothetical protein
MLSHNYLEPTVLEERHIVPAMAHIQMESFEATNGCYPNIFSNSTLRNLHLNLRGGADTEVEHKSRRETFAGTFQKLAPKASKLTYEQMTLLDDAKLRDLLAVKLDLAMVSSNLSSVSDIYVTLMATNNRSRLSLSSEVVSTRKSRRRSTSDPVGVPASNKRAHEQHSHSHIQHTLILPASHRHEHEGAKFPNGELIFTSTSTTRYH